MKRRRPQPRCTCGHAKSQHYAALNSYYKEMDIDLGRRCGFCLKCEEYKQDNLATLERLYIFKEGKERIRE